MEGFSITAALIGGESLNYRESVVGREENEKLVSRCGKID